MSGCTYTDACGALITASCNGLAWEVDEPSESCNPPPPCPEDLPAEASACELTPGGTPVGCVYEVETACGPAQAAAECVLSKATEEYVWSITVPPCEQ